MTVTDEIILTQTPDASVSEPRFTTSISAAELLQQRSTPAGASAVRLVDVRSAGEFDSVRIDGSNNIPLDQLPAALNALAKIDAPLVLICASGNRAQQAQRLLMQAGHEQAVVLTDGIAGWRAAGGELIETSGKWAMDRQVRGVAGSIVLASVLTSVAFPKARFIAGGIGAGLAYSALSNTCAMAKMLGKLPYNKGPEADINQALQQLANS